MGKNQRDGKAPQGVCLKRWAARLRVTSGTILSGNPPLRGDRRRREPCSRDTKSVGHFSIYRRWPFNLDQKVERSVICEVEGNTVGKKEALRAATVRASETDRRVGSSTMVLPLAIKGTRLGMSAQLTLSGTVRKYDRLQESARRRGMALGRAAISGCRL